MSTVTVSKVPRQTLIDAVEHAVSNLRDAEDRNAVREFARTCVTFAAGAWVLDGCYCPSSGCGIDRFQMDAQAFAIAFDQFFGIGGSYDGRPMICQVVDPWP